MTVHYQTRLTGIGPDVADLAQDGVVILFAEGAPPELAEVAVLHRNDASAGPAPAPGARVVIGDVEATVTAVGETAWKKVADIGHVVFSFNGAQGADRPGEICASAVDAAALIAALKPGATLTIESAG